MAGHDVTLRRESSAEELMPGEGVELAARILAGLKLEGTTKYVLRALAERRVAPGSLTKPKRGFLLSIGAWLRNELRPVVTEHLLGVRFAERGLFAPGYLRSLVEEHLSGARDHTYRVWAPLRLELWLVRIADGVLAPLTSEATNSR